MDPLYTKPLTVRSYEVDLHGVDLPVDLEIAYRAEIFLGETAVARCKRVDDEAGPVFHHQLVRGEDNVELTRLVTRWRERPKRY